MNEIAVPSRRNQEVTFFLRFLSCALSQRVGAEESTQEKRCKNGGEIKLPRD